MFFRRQQVKEPSFEDRLARLAEWGFQAERQPDGRVRVSRGGCAATVADVPGSPPRFERAGWVFGDKTALLVDAGYQKFWRVGERRRAPALAHQLTELHAFEEDLREALGLESLYNTSLGTTNDLHLYDRLEGRERPGPPSPWRKTAQAADK